MADIKNNVTVFEMTILHNIDTFTSICEIYQIKVIFKKKLKFFIDNTTYKKDNRLFFKQIHRCEKWCELTITSSGVGVMLIKNLLCTPEKYDFCLGNE